MAPGPFPDELKPGSIVKVAQFYEDEQGNWLPKFALVLAFCQRSHDIVWRLLTSRQHGRPEAPCCYHGDPVPGYFLGIIDPDGPLAERSWLDLRQLDDCDFAEAIEDLRSGRITHICKLPDDVFKLAASCAAAADDTSTGQEGLIRDHLASL